MLCDNYLYYKKQKKKRGPANLQTLKSFLCSKIRHFEYKCIADGVQYVCMWLYNAVVALR